MLLPTPLTYLFAFTVPGGDTAPASSLVLFGACAAVLSLLAPRPGDPGASNPLAMMDASFRPFFFPGVPCDVPSRTISRNSSY